MRNEKKGMFNVGDQVIHHSEKEWGIGVIIGCVETTIEGGLYTVCWPSFKAVAKDGYPQHKTFYGNALLLSKKITMTNSRIVSSIDMQIDTKHHKDSETVKSDSTKIWDYWYSLGIGESACIANVIKYLARAGNKPGQTKLQDFNKAKQYLDKLILEEKEKEKEYERCSWPW